MTMKMFKATRGKPIEEVEVANLDDGTLDIGNATYLPRLIQGDAFHLERLGIFPDWPAARACLLAGVISRLHAAQDAKESASDFYDEVEKEYHLTKAMTEPAEADVVDKR